MQEQPADQTRGHVRSLVVCLAACIAAELVGGAFTASGLRDWYGTLAKPDWNPPNWVFGPVWTVLYVLMGIAVWLVWRQRAGGSLQWPIALFAAQLALNVLWSALFFTCRSPGAAAIEIVVLWLAILLTIVAFVGVSRAAAWLMAPYLAWVSFASALNFAVWRLNA